MTILKTQPSVSAYETAVFTHTFVTFTDREGRTCSAYVNPTMFAAHGLAAMEMPGWHEGERGSR
jgi:hypothetical protein